MKRAFQTKRHLNVVLNIGILTIYQARHKHVFLGTLYRHSEKPIQKTSFVGCKIGVPNKAS